MVSCGRDMALTIYDLPREMAALPISWGELLTIALRSPSTEPFGGASRYTT